MPFRSELNPRQQEAINAVQGPVMVVAGPGSGKTRVLTFKIAHLIGIGVPPYQILALTFTNKAAGEMRERIIPLVGEKSRQLWMGTFHSIFARILRVECEALGFQKNFSIYDPQDSLTAIKNLMAELGIPSQQYNPQAIRSRISSAKNHLVSPDEYARSAAGLFDEKTALLFASYQRRLKENNAMDFDDLLLKPIELFSGQKKILKRYQDRFRFILIDEYQDTNRAQYVLIKLLADAHRNLCVVGDDAQSIYAFRGADIRNILEFEKDYPEATIIRLEQNYRSTGTILQAADRVIKNNVDQISKNLWTENQTGEAITVLACEDDREEGEMIVRRIFEESLDRKAGFKDFAVMYRTNAQSRSLEEAFRRNSIPYVIIGGIEFYQRKEVKDVLAYLRLLVNPGDDVSFLRIVNTPARGLGEAAIKALKRGAAASSRSLLDAAATVDSMVGVTPKARGGFRSLSALMAKYRQVRDQISIGELARALVDDLGILRLYKEEGTAESMGRWENVQELLSGISEFSASRPEAKLEDFLQEVSLIADVDEWDDHANAVTLLTLHSAKGLEFPVVFITGLEEGLLPFYSEPIDRKDLEEERRLFYVGMTRAMRKLYLSHTRIRFRFAEMTYQSPSRFLEEVPPELIETVASRGKYSRLEAAAAGDRRRRPGREKIAEPRSSPFPADEFPDYENGEGELEKLHVGGLVEHELFGRGKVLHLSGKGESLKAVVNFPSAGKKNLLLKYARLKIL